MTLLFSDGDPPQRTKQARIHVALHLPKSVGYSFYMYACMHACMHR